MRDIEKFEPTKLLRNLRNEIDTLFDRFVEKPIGLITGQVIPAIDIAETDSEIIVKAELPGIDLEDIDVSISGDTLVIKGEKKKETEQAGRTFHIIERAYGKFTRSVRLPTDIDADNVKASYKNGVLEIVLPKKEPAKTKRIEIKSE